jgi:hypothetical protein
MEKDGEDGWLELTQTFRDRWSREWRRGAADGEGLESRVDAGSVLHFIVASAKAFAAGIVV